MNRNIGFLRNTTNRILNTTESNVDTSISKGILTNSENVEKYLCSV